MKKYLLVLITLAFLFLVYRFATFPILNHHSPACLCNQCLEEFEADRPN